VIYKPRRVRTEAVWNAMLLALNDAGIKHPMMVPQIVELDHSGWQEFVPQEHARDEAALVRFYHRLGTLLALLRATNTTDAHCQNVVASGEYPIMVDCETVFQPELKPRYPSKAMPFSVLDTGILPSQLSLGVESAIDISALGAVTSASWGAATMLAWDERTGPQLVSMPVLLEGAISAPVEDGRRAAGQHAAAIIDGFSEAYDVLRRDQSALTRLASQRAASDGIHTRVIVRPTCQYGQLLNDLRHPLLQSDSTHVERTLNQLRGASEAHAERRECADSEIHDLRLGDVPAFTAALDSLCLRDSSGNETQPVLSANGMERLAETTALLSERDKGRQIWIIEAALSTVGSDGQRWTTSRLHERLKGACAEGGARTWARVGDVVSEAVSDLEATQRSDAAWWHSLHRRSGGWTVAAATPRLYDGVAGTALALAYFARAVDALRYTRVAERALDSVLSAVRGGGLGNTKVGFDGSGGLIFALTHLASVLGREDARDEAATLARTAMLDRKCESDVMSGLAGWIKCVSPLARTVGQEEVVGSVSRAADALARRVDDDYDRGTNRAVWLTGYAHGASGIADALAAAYCITGETRYRDSARRTLEVEAAAFDAAAGHWADRRQEAPTDARASGWCHGAPGIAVARLNISDAAPEIDCGSDLQRAVALTLADGDLQDHSLCHGAFGRLDIVLEAGRRAGRTDWEMAATESAIEVAIDVELRGVRCGFLHGANPIIVPGFMTGLAGMAYAAARWIRHDTPCLLALGRPID